MSNDNKERSKTPCGGTTIRSKTPGNQKRKKHLPYPAPGKRAVVWEE